MWEFARLAYKLTPLFSADPRPRRFSRKSGLATPLESALMDTPPLTSLESALTENGGGGTYLLHVTRCFPVGRAWETAVDCWRWLRVRGSEGAAGRALAPCWI